LTTAAQGLSFHGLPPEEASLLKTAKGIGIFSRLGSIPATPQSGAGLDPHQNGSGDQNGERLIAGQQAHETEKD
jgi:hypothetical protein